MQFCFLDDSRQRRPRRDGMGELVALGSIVIAAERVGATERALAQLCSASGFPADEEFKWSPSTSHWMRRGLVDQARTDFYLQVMDVLAGSGCRVVMAVRDVRGGSATGAETPEADAATMLLERLDGRMRALSDEAVIVADRPGGGPHEATAFVREVERVLTEGTDYVKPTKIALNALLSDSKALRMLQAADLVVAATLTVVAGNAEFAGPVFERILPLFYRDSDRIGGIGLKLHPDAWYANLYHWLLGDTHLWRRGVGRPLPMNTRPYKTSADVF